MINTINNLDSLDFTDSSAEAIKLTEVQIIQASELASLTEENQQWQNYLNNLALFGFQRWLNDRNPQYRLNVNNSQNILNAVSYLKIGEFRICLLTQGILEDEVISLPEDVISNRESNGNLAHFYVLVTVDEEQEEVNIEGLIRYDQLNAYMQSPELILHSDRTYDLPLNCFDADINHLLLYLSYLQPSAIQLPVSNSSNVINSSSTTVENSPSTQASISTSSNVINSPSTSAENSPSIEEKVKNVASWLNGKLDELSENLSWVLLPSPELASGFRNTANQSTYSIIDELKSEGVIPDGAKIILLNPIENTDLQLYAITWILPEDKWALLLILKHTDDDLNLPFGLNLQIKSEDEILKEETFSYENEEDYLQTQVEGIINQQFTITISLNNQDLETFIF